eukprot:1711286-Prymnesium_polylepis.1
MDLSGLVKPLATLSYSGMCTVAMSRCVIPSLSLQAKMAGRPDGAVGAEFGVVVFANLSEVKTK